MVIGHDALSNTFLDIIPIPLIWPVPVSRYFQLYQIYGINAGVIYNFICRIAIKDRTESFDDYFPCKLKNCKLKHVRNWLRLFVDHHNKESVVVM